jgi:hypothetical protein
MLFSSSDEATINHYHMFRIWEVSAGTDYRIGVQQKNADTVDIVYGDTVLETDTWYHAILQSDGSAYSIYLNWEEESLTVHSGANNGDWFGDISNKDSATIGVSRRTSDVLHFNGSIDEPRIYNRALSAQEIQRIYNEEKPK